jgi:hypothetical protein
MARVHPAKVKPRARISLRLLVRNPDRVVVPGVQLDEPGWTPNAGRSGRILRLFLVPVQGGKRDSPRAAPSGTRRARAAHSD